MNPLYRFLYFSFGDMSIHRQHLNYAIDDLLSGDCRLVRYMLLPPKEYHGCKKIRNSSQIFSNFSYSSGHKFYHMCHHILYPEIPIYEIEILDYDGKGRI